MEKIGMPRDGEWSRGREVTAAEERFASIDQCLSGDSQLHHEISDLGERLSKYNDSLPASFRLAAANLNTRVGRLQFRMGDMYDQLHKKRKVSLPNTEHLEQLQADWAEAAVEAKQFTEDLKVTNDSLLIEEAEALAAAIKKMASIVAATTPAGATQEELEPGQEKLAA